MLYTYLTKKAMKIAYEAHKNQLDKSGIPYIYHVMAVASNFDGDENLTCIALLHDVLEDSNMTADDLKAEGFPDEIIKAVRLLTHDKNTSYIDYIKDIKQNKYATAVKIADLKHNCNLSRLDKVKDKDTQRVRKYITALNYLAYDQNNI